MHDFTTSFLQQLHANDNQAVNPQEKALTLTLIAAIEPKHSYVYRIQFVNDGKTDCILWSIGEIKLA